MKKLSTIAVSVAVIAGVAAGGSWYTGKQIEQHYNDFVVQANQELQQLSRYDVEAKLKDVKLTRGVFSSDVTYNFDVIAGEKNYQFKGSDKIYHGPFPINRLMKGNVVPVMASAESRVALDESLKPFFAKPELLVAQTNVSYGQEVSGEATFSSIKFQSETVNVSMDLSDDVDLDVEVAEFTTKFDLDKVGLGKVKTAFPLIKVKDRLSNTHLLLEQTEYNVDLKDKQGYSALSVGDIEMKAKSYKMGRANVEVSINDIAMKGYNKINNDVYEGKADFVGNVELVSEKTGKQPFGKLKFDLFTQMDAKSVNELMFYLNNPEQLESEEAVTEVQALFEKPIKFHLNDFSLENSKGKSKIDFILNTTGVKMNEIHTLQTIEAMLNIFPKSGLSIHLDIAALEESAKQIAALDSQDNVEAQQIAKQQIELFLQQVKSIKTFEVDEKTAKLHLEIDQGKMKLNGRELSEQEVQNALFVLMLMLSR